MELFTGTGDEAMDVLAFPGVDISGVNSSPPLVDCGQHPQLGGRVYLAAHHVIDAVHAIGPVLSVDQRAMVAANVGAVIEADAQELHDRIAELEQQVAELEANRTVPLADVLAHLAQDATAEPEPEPEPEPKAPAEEPSTPDVFPKSEGGGWYLLSDGSKVQGHDNAVAAQAKLAEAS